MTRNSFRLSTNQNHARSLTLINPEIATKPKVENEDVKSSIKQSLYATFPVASMSTNQTESERNLDNKTVTFENKGNSLKEKSMAVAGQGRKKFFVCAIGVFVSYFYYGILQESM